jgi:two-component system nitrate/nitrite response regulator NarL
MNTLRVLIIAGDPLARAGLAAFLQDRSDLVVIGQVDGAELLASLDLYRPDVVLWDLGWEASTGMRGEVKAALAQLAELSENNPPVAVLVPTPSAATDAWAAGARGLLPREVGAEQLAAALAALSWGLIAIDPLFSVALSPTPHAAPDLAEPIEALTPREIEVLRLIAEGLPNKTIAQRLGISEHTIKFHTNALMTKLGAQSRTDAVVRATRLGLIIL